MIAQLINGVLAAYPGGSFSISVEPTKVDLPARQSISYKVGEVLWVEANMCYPADEIMFEEALHALKDSLDRGSQKPGVPEKLTAHYAARFSPTAPQAARPPTPCGPSAVPPGG